MPRPFDAMVLFDYDAVEEGEASMKRGQVSKREEGERKRERGVLKKEERWWW